MSGGQSSLENSRQPPATDMVAHKLTERSTFSSSPQPQQSATHFKYNRDDEDYSDAAGTPGVQVSVTSLPVDHMGTTVYLKCWRPETGASQSILIVHDLGEQTNLYRECALDYVQEGYAVYAFDLRGHGRSGRRLGHAPSFNILVKDLLQVAAWVRHCEGGQAPAILGHGIGALILVDFLKSFGSYCQAAILSAPAVELANKISAPTRILIKVLAELSPTLRLPAALTPRFAKTLRHDLQEEASTTRHNYFPRLSAIFAHELLMAIDRLETLFTGYQGPILILCPDQDKICKYTRVQQTSSLPSKAADSHRGIKIVKLPDVGHHIFTEDALTRRRAAEVILPWLNETLKTPHT